MLYYWNTSQSECCGVLWAWVIRLGWSVTQTLSNEYALCY